MAFCLLLSIVMQQAEIMYCRLTIMIGNELWAVTEHIVQSLTKIVKEISYVTGIW